MDFGLAKASCIMQHYMPPCVAMWFWLRAIF
jgi:hypothetical protein